MKIGEFTKKFGLNKSTVRYYTDNHLLLPKTNGTYPDYDATCQKDMEDIIKLKEMGFSIQEIMKIKAKERLYIDYSGPHEKILDEVLENKIIELKDELVQIQGKIAMIRKHQQRNPLTPHPLSYGLPFEALNFLACPKCRSAFNIDSATIANQRIISGDLKCSCGSHFQIREGIVYPFEQTISKSKARTQDQLNLTDALTNEHISILKKAGQVVCKQLQSWDASKGIVFINADIDVLLMNVTDSFVDDGMYIFCSPESTSLELFRRKMSRIDVKGRIIFICYESDIPLIDDLDYFVDNAGYAFDIITHQEEPSFLKFTSLMSDHAKCSLLNLESVDVQKQSIPNAYLDMYMKNGFKIKETLLIGTIKALGPLLNVESLDSDFEVVHCSLTKERT